MVESSTDIYFNPNVFEPIYVEEVPAHGKSFLKNCHRTLIAKFKDKKIGKEFVAASSHLEAGIFKIQKQIRIEQLSEIITKLENLNCGKIIFGLDGNDLEKRKKNPFSQIENQVNKL